MVAGSPSVRRSLGVFLAFAEEDPIVLGDRFAHRPQLVGHHRDAVGVPDVPAGLVGIGMPLAEVFRNETADLETALITVDLDRQPLPGKLTLGAQRLLLGLFFLTVKPCPLANPSRTTHSTGSYP